MKKYLLLAGFSAMNMLSAQLGINTNNPQTAFHVDGAKDNAVSGAPTATQQINDFTGTSLGNIGVGTSSPTAKIEVNSGTLNTSGLKFRTFTSSTPVSSSGQTLGVDTTGNIVTVPNPGPPAVVTNEYATSSPFNYNVNDLGYTTITGSERTLNIPAGGKAVFINFMLGIDFFTPFPAGSGAGYYRATLFIDGVPTNVYMVAQERQVLGSQTQYSLSTVKSLSEGTHNLDVRMIRSANNNTVSGANMVCRAISMSFNASYIN